MNETTSTEQPTGGVQAATPQRPLTQMSSEVRGWSWGAFVLGPLFFVAVRKYSYLLIYLLIPASFVFLVASTVIPELIFVFFITYLGSLIGPMVYLGRAGRRLAAESRTFANRDEYIGFMKGIDHAGRVWFVFMTIGFVIGLMWVVVWGLVQITAPVPTGASTLDTDDIVFPNKFDETAV